MRALLGPGLLAAGFGRFFVVREVGLRVVLSLQEARVSSRPPSVTIGEPTISNTYGSLVLIMAGMRNTLLTAVTSRRATPRR